MVALIAVLSSPAKTTRETTSLTRSRDGRNPATRDNRKAPTSASSVFPVAIARSLSTGPAVVMLARKAPTQIAGHIR